MHEKLQSKAINPKILQQLSFQHLYCNPLLSKVLLVLLILTKESFVYVDYQFVIYV
jgi:hypothetical protein